MPARHWKAGVTNRGATWARRDYTDIRHARPSSTAVPCGRAEDVRRRVWGCRSHRSRRSLASSRPDRGRGRLAFAEVLARGPAAGPRRGVDVIKMYGSTGSDQDVTWRPDLHLRGKMKGGGRRRPTRLASGSLSTSYGPAGRRANAVRAWSRFGRARPPTWTTRTIAEMARRNVYLRPRRSITIATLRRETASNSDTARMVADRLNAYLKTQTLETAPPGT